MANEPSAKRQRFGAKVVTVRVGEDPAEDFFIHEGTLKKHSEFFKCALDKKWKEGQSGVIELPEDEAEVFSRYANWLYDNKLDVKLDTELLERETAGGLNDEDIANKRDWVLAKCYVLGEKLLDAKFCNAVMRRFLKNTSRDWTDGGNGTTAASLCNYVYEHTPPGSPIREFLVDLWISEQQFGYDIEDDDVFHPEFARDLLKVYMSNAKEGRFVDICSQPSKKYWFKAE